MKFVDHEGFDWDGIQKALEKNQKRGKAVAGGSTISQQLAKNLFLSGERSYWRKGQEAVITLMLEYALDKRRILELYLNVAEWGEGVFGCEAAARHYFNVSASQLSAEQSARLAAMLPRPQYYDRNRGSTVSGAIRRTHRGAHECRAGALTPRHATRLGEAWSSIRSRTGWSVGPLAADSGLPESGYGWLDLVYDEVGSSPSACTPSPACASTTTTSTTCAMPAIRRRSTAPTRTS